MLREVRRDAGLLACADKPLWWCGREGGRGEGLEGRGRREGVEGRGRGKDWRGGGRRDVGGKEGVERMREGWEEMREEGEIIREEETTCGCLKKGKKIAKREGP